MNTVASLAIVAAISACAPLATAQVVITEVHPGQGWIELENRGSSTADLGAWSLYCTTATPGMPNTYWWGFPASTTLAAGSLLRVHWFHRHGTPTATELYTGTSNRDFLFGLGGEQLRPAIGSVALCTSQLGDDMGTASTYVDWITWGMPHRPREFYAAVNGRWLAGTFVAAPDSTSSIALGANPSSEPTPVSEFFLDTTPTPGTPNQQGASVAHYGHDCAVGAMNAPRIEVLGIPAVGNPNFTLRAVGTDGTRGQTVIFLFGFAQTTGLRLPLTTMTCPLWVDAGAGPLLAVATPAPTGLPYTDFPLSLASMTAGSIGWTVYTQALVGVLPFTSFDHAASAGVAITFGG